MEDTHTHSNKETRQTRTERTGAYKDRIITKTGAGNELINILVLSRYQHFCIRYRYQ